jgi:hypothetical protein
MGKDVTQSHRMQYKMYVKMKKFVSRIQQNKFQNPSAPIKEMARMWFALQLYTLYASRK